jgi:outer membrane protein TolC
MITKIFLAAVLFAPLQGLCQHDSVNVPESVELDLRFLTVEALMNNPEIKAELQKMDVMEARVLQAGSLDAPELKFMQEAMPDFRFNQAMYSRFELMQTIPFPTKLDRREDLSRIEAGHAHNEHLEKVNEVLSKLKSAYYELWFLQQNIILDQENARLINQLISIARAKYGVGETSQQDVLKGQVELHMVDNDLITLRQRELSAKAMMMSILNRSPRDTLGFAVIPDDAVFDAQLDSLLQWALENRPMIVHDSLSIAEQQMNLSLARLDYWPDFKLGLERMTSPSTDFRGWSVSASMTIPLAPWTLGRSSARIEEASASIDEARSDYNAARNMVAGNIKDLYYKIDAGKKQLDLYRTAILPEARQSLDASLASYQTGRTDFLMLTDAYRTYVNLTREYFMVRMQFEQNIGGLEREVGTQNLSSFK